MSSRRKFSSKFKTKVVLEALKERDSIQSIAQKYNVHQTQISLWKREFLEGSEQVFEKGSSKSKPDQTEVLLKIIGEQKVEIDFLKKNAKLKSMSERKDQIRQNDSSLSMVKRCKLLNVSRSSVYYKPSSETALNLELMKQMDKHYLEHPEKGAAQMLDYLRFDLEYKVNHKRIERLYYKVMGLRSLQPGPHTSKRHQAHPVFPYLLRGLKVNQAMQVWQMDISYIPMARGFMTGRPRIWQLSSMYIVGAL